jgi:hypothetical protein
MFCLEISYSCSKQQLLNPGNSCSLELSVCYNPSKIILHYPCSNDDVA